MRVPDLLRTMDIFESLPAEQLETIAHLLHEQRLAEGEVLFQQGDVGDSMFIVTGGRIRLWTTDPSGNEKILTSFTDGQFFGEMSLLTGAPRSGSASADAESRVLVLQKDDFDHLLASTPQVMREMLKVVSRRTVQTNQQLLAEEPGIAASSGTGRVYAVFSPRGGGGKTTVAVNLAAALARMLPDRVALVDLDLAFGHVPALLHLEPETSLAQLPSESLETLDRRTLGHYLVPHVSGLYVLPCANKPEEGEAITGEHVRAALGVLKRQFLVTVVDYGVAFNDPTLAALEVSDRIVLLCTPELNALRDVRECQRIFGEVLHIEKSKSYYVLNHYQPFRVLSREQFETALEQPVTLEIPHAGEAAMKAATRGEPLVLAGGGAFARGIEKLANDLLPPDVTPAKAKPQKIPVTVGTVSRNGSLHRPKGGFRLFKRT